MKLSVGRGLAGVGNSTENQGGQLEEPRRAQGVLRGFVIQDQDGGKVNAASHSRRLGTEQSDWKIGKENKSEKIVNLKIPDAEDMWEMGIFKHCC